MKNRVSQIDNSVKIQNVLLSVSDKGGLEEFVPALLEINPEITFFSTGGTYTKVKEILGEAARYRLVAVSDYTGQPEMQGGLVKTLDFKIYLGLLSETYNPDHRKDQQRIGAVNFDMVIVNLYPFEETVSREGIVLEEARANIDIGGPCMIRASAKNFLRVASVCDPADYPSLIEELKVNGGALSLARRFDLAKKAFSHTAAYDTAIAAYLTNLGREEVEGIYDYQDEEPRK